MFPRKITSASLLTGTVRTASTTARRIARSHSRLTAAAATTATAGAIAAVAVAAPWGASASSAAASGPGQHAAMTSVRADVSAKPAALPHAGTFGKAHAAAKPAPAKPAVRPALVKPAAAKPAAAKPAAKPTGPTTIYDSVSPASIPSGQAEAVYANGSYQASSAQTAGHKTMWIDTNGSKTGADALDVEPGDATPAGAAAWVSAKLTKDPGSTAIVYTFKSDWGPTQAEVNALPSWMHSHVKYWIADPTGSRHILPGAAATQWYWGKSYDVTAAQPGFFK